MEAEHMGAADMRTANGAADTRVERVAAVDMAAANMAAVNMEAVDMEAVNTDKR
jgi:hypothetical protein